MADLVIRVAGDDEIAAAGALTAEAYHADQLIDDGDEYLDELTDAARRAREATLLVALVPAAPRPEDDDAGHADDGTSDEGELDVPRRQPRNAPATTVVGTITLAPAGSSYAEVGEPGEVEIRMLAVAPEARRRGIAEALMRAAMIEAVTLGAGRIVLSTLAKMDAAHRLYDRLGFVRAPERDWGHEGVELRVYVWDLPTGPGSRVEAATWRPREVRDVQGWQVGLSEGFTRRANSVLALAEPDDVTTAIAEVERVYREHHQPPIFRVCSQTLPDELHRVLLDRGYRDVAHTLVLVRDLGDKTWEAETEITGTPPLDIVAADEPDDEWLAGWLEVKATHPVEKGVAASVVGGSPALYLTARDDEGVVGVVRAALADEWVALSCLVVAPRARRRGVGRALTVAALEAGTARGATRAFLQVEERNTSAVALYEGLGFTPAERYHYVQR